jgi:hypothetical protein
MSFLDNLENNLKSLESSEQGKDDAERQRRLRDSERERAKAAAPFAEELRNSPFTAELLTHAARIGHGMRIKVHVAWLGSTLRLEARERRLELRPTPEGIVAVYLDDHNQETGSGPVDLADNPETLVRELLDAGKI